MNNNLLRLQTLIIISFFSFSCNSETEKTSNADLDTASKEITVVKNLPAYDKSRSVTVISPGLYKQMADTLNIRMISGIYKPGDSSIMHGHPDFAMYVLEGGTVELTAEDGTRQNIEFKKDMAVIMPASTHSAKNVGKTTLKLVVVEVNRPRD
jgi:quercetin dioxygenase-like cupin family protein